MEQIIIKPKKIGLLGGTFDPVHNGHLAVAEHVLQTFGLNAIWFVPSATPPHKPGHSDGENITGFRKRVIMLEKALAPFKKFKINHIESERTSPSYSIDTLIEIRKRAAADTEFFFILGLDAFAEIDTWKRYRELTDFVDLVIVSRGSGDTGVVENIINEKLPDYQKDRLTNTWSSNEHKGILILEKMKPVAISSSMVRERIRKGLEFSDLVPSGVAEYLKANKIYRKI